MIEGALKGEQVGVGAQKLLQQPEEEREMWFECHGLNMVYEK